jgi:putative hydrolase
MGDPSNEGNPLQGLLGDLLKVIGGAQTGGANPWLDAARAMAQGVASDGAPEANTDPIRRIELEELTRVAELHVANATGLSTAAVGRRTPAFEPVTRGAWALRSLESWRPWVQKLVDSQHTSAPPASPPGFDESGAGALQDLLGRFALTMGPVLLGMQLGSAAGHLAKRAMGQYAIPVPWPDSDELLVVPDNVSAFAEDWSLPADQTRLWVCVRELTVHAVIARPHVSARLRELIEDAMASAAEAQQDVSDRIQLSSADPELLQNLMSDPESLLADLLTPGRQNTSARLTSLTTVIAAYADHITATVAATLTPSAPQLSEAWVRYRSAEDSGEQAAGALLGADFSRHEVERGSSFIHGVVERAGEQGLERLWSNPRNLPTPAEVDAPGLWLERIDLPVDEIPPDAGADRDEPDSDSG